MQKYLNVIGCLIGLFAMSVLIAGDAAAQAKKPKPARCADGCYSHCAKRAAEKVTASIAGCQSACQRTHCQN